ncbi:MAG: hypothetical protein ACI9KN_002201 [Gammaproteobacteria bacterium]|jgi:hypothetical protein
MALIFHDISKYYAASIYDNLLNIGRIILHDGSYMFARDVVQGPFNLVADTEKDVTALINVIGEVHPLSALDGILNIDLQSCLYLNENHGTNEIEVRSIHKGMGTSIYSKQECPLILWNPNYESDQYFDVIDIQGVFSTPRLKESFLSIISQSLRELELFPPLMHLKK